MSKSRCFFAAVAALAFAGGAFAAEIQANGANLVGTDHLGRVLPTVREAGPTNGRQVGLFYYLWMGHHGTQGPYDISKILASDPKAYEKPDSPLWPDPTHTPMLFWGEPLFGYYLSDDEWVIRRHVQMFIDAGIDVLYFDTTNGYHFKNQTDKLFAILEEYRRKGFKVPKFCYYMAPARRGSGTSNVRDVWDNYYSKGLYRELWFMWEGKPLLITHPDRPYPQELLDFFTFRRPTWGTPSKPDTWYWSGMPTQNVAVASTGVREMVPVTVATPHCPQGVKMDWEKYSQPSCSEAWFGRPSQSRSWHDGHLDTRPDAAHWGFFFKSQIDWALAPERRDVPLAFVCQWNEWLVPFLTKKSNDLYVMKHWLNLVDEADMEHSRDIEPMKGGYKDAYYFQLIDFVRRFKGMDAPAVAQRGDTVAYTEMTGDCAPRNHRGYDACGVYRNHTGRNEFKRLTVSCDGKRVVFAAETVNPLTVHVGANWMNLFVKVPGQPVDAMGYTHRLTPKTADITCAYQGSRIVYTVPAAFLGVDATNSFALEFKWSDNRQADDVMDFYVNGDAAPRGRLNWLFSCSAD